jgi:hypothetical protein
LLRDATQGWVLKIGDFNNRYDSLQRFEFLTIKKHLHSLLASRTRAMPSSQWQKY